MKNLKSLLFGMLGAMVSYGALCAAELSGTASVNVTSDTSATAKSMAFDEARRQIIVDALSPYSDSVALRAAVSGEKSSALMPLIASSGISGEQLSDTTYSAKITMTVNRRAAKNWLASHDIQNWLSIEDVGSGTFPMVLVLNNRMNDWTSVRRIAAGAGIDLNTASIENGEITFNVATQQRGAITIALRNAGWRYKDHDGALYIYK
ncbi:MAG: hypothetical protein J5742_01400 [Alphaproteobacteria bacterium]|nr:hypothetical protein [Alphaproteobacteria bacterium]